MIRFALLVRYTSAQAYKILLQHFPFPSFSLLSKLKSSNVDAIKAAQLLREKDAISEDIVLMADEMYLQKCVQYSGGDYVGADADENLYKGIVVFMIQGLKHTVPLVVKASPEVSVSGQWLASYLSDCIESLGNAGFNVRGIVTDNHSANVSAFNHLQKMFPSSLGDVLCMQHPQNSSKTYLFFDTVHLVKNIRNNLLNASKFVFPAFSFSLKDQVLASSESGYIRWRDFQDIFEEDAKHKANLRMAPKLTPCSLHPGNNKQNVGLALAIFHETTIAACKSYFPQRKDVIAFFIFIE